MPILALLADLRTCQDLLQRTQNRLEAALEHTNTHRSLRPWAPSIQHSLAQVGAATNTADNLIHRLAIEAKQPAAQEL